MTKLDKYFSVIIIGFIIPIFLFLIFGYLSFIFIKNYIPLFITLGIIVGIIFDVLFLKKISVFFYKNNYLPIIIYFLYMTGIFGFFMGVPIFNIIPGVFAGFYIGRKTKINKLNFNSYKKVLTKTNILTSITLFFFMGVSSIIALTDKYTGSNIKGMLNLQYEINKFEILLIIIIGGLFLLLLQNILSLFFGNLAIKKIFALQPIIAHSRFQGIITDKSGR